MRIVLDTNVMISALIFGGLPRRILDLVTFGLCDFFYSPAIEEEVRRVLADKFGWEATQLDSRLPILFGWGTKVEPQVSLTIVEDDPDDNRILECAEASNADVIVSGDHHLLRLGSFRTIRIHSPREFLESEMWRSPIS